jgi:hypothetical protein
LTSQHTARYQVWKYGRFCPDLSSQLSATILTRNSHEWLTASHVTHL